MSSMTSHCIISHGAFSYLAPPWNLTLALPTVAVQPTLLTSGRPVSSLLIAILEVTESPFTFKSNEPLSFLLRERRHCCSKSVMKWVKLCCVRRTFFSFTSL